MTQSRDLPGTQEDPWAIDPRDFPVRGSPAEQLRFLLNYAVLAPSGHNSQPWLFRLADDGIDVLADQSRRLPVVDPEDRELTMSCAAAAQTFVLAAEQFGLSPTLSALPRGEGSEVIATIKVGSDSLPSPSFRVLEAIRQRRTTRSAFEPDPLPPELRRTCMTTAEAFGISVGFATDGASHDAIARLVAEGDRRQFDDPAFRDELAQWLRSRKAPERDGMSGSAFGMPDALTGVGAFVIRTFDIGGVAASGDARKIRDGSPLFMVLASASDRRSDWVATGRALVDVLTTLSAEGWTASYLNQPIEVPELRPELKDALHIDGEPQLLLRVGKGAPPQPAPRRPVEEVLVR